MPKPDSPPWIHSIGQELKDISVTLLFYFLTSLIIWPLVICVSLAVIPLVYISRSVIMRWSLRCSCRQRFFKCFCRQLASSQECYWISDPSVIIDCREFQAKLAYAGCDENAHSEPLLSSTGQGQQNGSRCYGQSDINSSRLSSKNARGATPGVTDRTGVTDGKAVDAHHLVIVVDKGLTIDQLLSLIEVRIINLQTNDGQPYFPRFTQCLVRLAGGSLAWVRDPSFQLRNHVEIYNDPVATETDLRKLIELRMLQNLAAEIPLWQLVVAKDYGTLKDIVLIWRFHPAVFDGVSITKILAYTMANPKMFQFHKHSQSSLFTPHMAKFLLLGPARLIYLLVKGRSRNQLCVNSTPETNKEVCALWSEGTISYAHFLKNKLILKMTFNDILLGVLVGAFQDAVGHSSAKSHLSHCQRVIIPTDCWTAMNRSRNLPQGNHLVLLPMTTPAALKEVVPRLWGSEHYLSQLKNSADSVVHMLGLMWLHWMPTPDLWLQRARNSLLGGCSMLVTSLNGPMTLIAINGHVIRDIMYFTCPPPGVSSTYNFITYSGTVKLSVVSRHPDHNVSVDKLIRSMQRQMLAIDDMVFKRYFPDGVEGSPIGGLAASLSQPFVSRIYSEFLNRLKEIDLVDHPLPVQSPNGRLNSPQSQIPVPDACSVLDAAPLAKNAPPPRPVCPAASNSLASAAVTHEVTPIDQQCMDSDVHAIRIKKPEITRCNSPGLLMDPTSGVCSISPSSCTTHLVTESTATAMPNDSLLSTAANLEKERPTNTVYSCRRELSSFKGKECGYVGSNNSANVEVPEIGLGLTHTSFSTNLAASSGTTSSAELALPHGSGSMGELSASDMTGASVSSSSQAKQSVRS